MMSMASPNIRTGIAMHDVYNYILLYAFNYMMSLVCQYHYQRYYALGTASRIRGHDGIVLLITTRYILERDS